MFDAVIASVKTVAEGWKSEAAERQKRSRIDPVADTLLGCSSELLSQLEQLGGSSEWLTPEEYALCFPPNRRPSAQTVRRWCRTGVLAAVVSEGGYRIQRTARPKRRLRARA